MKCLLCHCSKKDELLYGEAVNCLNASVHYFCVLLSSNLPQRGKDHQGVYGFLTSDIKNLIRRCENVKCIYCNAGMATIKCMDHLCDNNFHLPCALEKGVLPIFNNLYQCPCHKHFNKQNLTVPSRSELSNIVCIICFDKFTRSEFISKSPKILQPPCCGVHYMHMRCAKLHAQNSGYYTKCPMCNNKKIYQRFICRSGVYIPHRDFSWEQDPNAFDYTLEFSCTALECVCPNGPEFTDDSESWRFKNCSYCGSSPVHNLCRPEKPYACDICRNI